MDDVINNLQRSVDEVDHETMKFHVGYYQIRRVAWRVLSGTITATEGKVELRHVMKLLEGWQCGQPSPFGDIE